MTERTTGEGSDRSFPLFVLVRQYGRSEAHYVIVAMVVGVVATFLSFADVYLIGLGIDALFDDRPFAVPFVPQTWVPTDPLSLLAFVTGLLVVLNVLTNLGGFVEEYGFGVFSQRVLHAVRTDAFAAVARSDLAFFDAARTGNVLSTLNDDVNRLDGFLNTIVGAALWITTTLVSAVVYMAALNPQLALVVLLAGPIIAGVNLHFSRRIEPLQDAIRTERGALNARLDTTLGGLDVIKASTAEGYERERVDIASREYTETRFAARRAAVRQSPVNRLLVGAWLVLVLAIGSYWITVEPPLFFTGTLTAGELVPFLFYLERLALPLTNLTGVIDGYTAAKASAKRIDGLLDDDRDHAAETTDTGADLTVENGRVAFEAVAFSYPDSDRRVLDGIDVTAEPGTTIGIVGETGAGKSTLVGLLLGFYDPDAGMVRIDGRDLRGVSAESLRNAIGYVSQEPFLFDGTVRENIAYGVPDVSDERIEAAAESAGAHEFITELPDGYRTRVGANGTALSGGQRQRIAIARAIVDDPPILVFDEATSHVDNETERILQANLADLTANRTTFVVAHRLSTVRDVDLICVLEDGLVTERGTHDALVERGGTYATLWNLQTGELSGAST